MRTFPRLLPLIAIIGTTTAALAQEADRPSAVERRRAVIERRLERIFAEKLDRKAPVAPESKRDAAPLMRAPSEVTVSSHSAQEAELHAVINPTDSNNIVISAIRTSPQQAGLALPIYYSRDFGETWRLSSFMPRAMGGGDPVFTADADGTLYYSWIELVLRSQTRIDEGILWSRSTDGGATWARADTIAYGQMTQGANGTTGKMSDKQWMAVDRSSSPRRGTLYTVFLQMEMTGISADLAIVVKRKPAGAAKFIREPVPVTDASFIDMQFASIGVDHRGDVHAFFFGQRDGDAEHRLWHSVSRDGAESFETPRPVGPIRFPARSNNVPEHLPQRLGALPQFAVDGGEASPHRGNLYAVWFSNDLNEQGPGTHFSPFHVYFARSVDGGASWSSPMRVNDDTTMEGVDHLYPSIDVAPNGAVVLTWYDGRQSPGNSDLHHYTAYSLDGGATLKPNIRVSTESSNSNAYVIGNFGIGDYTKCLSTNGYAIPIWVDGRGNDGNLDIFAAFVPLRESPSGVEVLHEVIASAQLSAAPNPAAVTSLVELTLRHAGEMRVELVDMLGTVVTTLASGRLDAGAHRLTLDCSAIAPGRYLVRAAGEAGTVTTPLEIVR